MQREPRWVNPLLIGAACVFMAAGGWRSYNEYFSRGIEVAQPSPVTIYGGSPAEIPLQRRLEQERALRQDLERQLDARLADQDALAEERARTKDLEAQLAAHQGDRDALTEERARTKKLEAQLAAHQGDRDALTKERARIMELEGQLAARQQAPTLALSREHARSQLSDHEPATRANATDGGERDAIVRLAVPASDSPQSPTRAGRNGTPASAPVMVGADKVASTEAPASPQDTNAEVARLLVRAKRLLEQGDVGAARGALERAAEAGSPFATFTLAETYDPIVLSAWGTVGTQGDAAKAQQLYAKAVAGGVEVAKDRLKALRSPIGGEADR